jgi:hypothetical protein
MNNKENIMNNKENIMNNKENIDNLRKYITQITVNDNYITKNIKELIKNEKFMEMIKKNMFLMGVNNSIGKNSLIKLLEMGEIEVIKKLVNIDNRILNYKNTNKTNFLSNMLDNDELYEFIYNILNVLKDEKTFFEKIITEKNNDNINFIEFIIMILSINNNKELLNKKINCHIKDFKCLSKKTFDVNIKYLIYILKLINDVDDKFNILTILCREINNSIFLYNIIKMLNFNNIDVYPDEENNSCIDYLILNNEYEILEYVIDRVNYINFLNFEGSSIYNIEINLKNINLIFKLLNKSNISKIKDKYNNNILLKILEKSKININNQTLHKIIKYFDIYEENNNGISIYKLLSNKNILNLTNNTNNNNINLKKILLKTKHGLFISDPIHNILYTLYLLKTYNNVSIPYKKYSKQEYDKIYKLIMLSNNENDIMNIIKIYFNYELLTHIIIWKNKNNYYINEDLIKYLEKNNNKRYIYIKLSIINSDNSYGSIRHANLILIDNELKTVERFEPYGDVYFHFGDGLNKMIEEEIANKLNYKFIFIQPYPGFQIRSDERNNNVRQLGDPGGFCLAWCFLYLECRIKFNLDGFDTLKMINNYIINKFEKDFNLFNIIEYNKYMMFIRYYGKYLDDKKNIIIKSLNIREEILYNNQVSNKLINEIIEKIIEEYKKIL